MNTKELINIGLQKDASDVHLCEGDPLVLRVDGVVSKFPEYPVTKENLDEVVDSWITVAQRKGFVESMHAVDFATNIDGQDMRCHMFLSGGKRCIAIRFMRAKIPTMDDLMLPKAFQQIIKDGRPTGLILVTGYTGSGKSTTLAASLNWLNQNEPLNIVTLEHPIEYRYKQEKSIIRQREVGRDVHDFNAGMVDAMREDPDVILIGELRDAETVKAAVSAAETGHLVFGTLHTRTAASTISRIFDVVPADERDQIRTMVASSLLAVIGQRLVPKISGGRVAVFELMVNCPAVAGAIRENRPGQLANEIAVKKELGMIDFDTCLLNYVRDKVITPEDAIATSDRPDELKKRLGR